MKTDKRFVVTLVTVMALYLAVGIVAVAVGYSQ